MNTAISKDEYRLRKLLWISHSNVDCMLYGDDGEMQCNSCGIDFKRMSVDEIEEKYFKRGMKQYLKTIEEKNEKFRD